MTDSKAISRIAVVACLACTVGFASIAVHHVKYPGFTEAMEGDVLQHVERAAQGKPIYTDATDEIIPLAYFPGYYYFAAPLYRLFGDDLAGPRLASSSAAMLSAVVIGWIVFRDSGNASAGLFSIALFFAGYRIKDENYTTALPDSALLLWLSLGWAMVLERRTWRTELAAGVFFALALFTKQQGLLLGGCGLLYLAVTNRNREWSFGEWRCAIPPILVWGGVAFTTIVLGDRMFGEWMTHFTIQVPSHWDRSYFHSFERFVLVSFLFVPFAWLGTACYAFRDGVRLRAFTNPLVFLIASASVVCLFTVAAAGSSNNHYIPLFTLLEAALVLGCFGIVRDGPPRWLLPSMITTAICGSIVEGGAALVNEGHPLPLFVAPILVFAAIVGWVIERHGLRAQWWAAVLLLGQFGASFYLPWDYWPPSDWRVAAEDFRSEIRRLDHNVAWPDYGAIPSALTGAPIHRFPSWVVLEDMSRAGTASSQDLHEFLRRMSERPPGWLITSNLLESIPVWNGFRDSYSLEIDYQSRFKPLRQLDRHWYGSLSFPRYLYRAIDRPHDRQNR